MLGALNTILKKIIGDKKEKDLEAIQPLLKATKSAYESISNVSADDVRRMSLDMQARIQKHVQHLEDEVDALNAKADALPLDALEEKEGIYSEVDKVRKTINEEIEKVLLEILPEAFAVIKRTAEIFKNNEEITVSANANDKEFATQTSKDYVRIEGDKAIWKNNWSAAGNRFTWDMVHYDVQLIGGIALHTGKVAEMATGEGKTLVATLPVFLNALANKGVHVVTVNDYLARRDSEWMGPLYEFHGLSVDCVDKHQPNSDARRNAYRSHITFGTNNEFGFDYLRDNMAVEASHLVQRKHHFAIIDEVDSVLIDEARTPLIISGPTSKGDQQEFDALKPKIQILMNAQKAAVTDFLTDAKKKLQPESGNPNKEELQEGGLALLRAYRGLPRNKALIKFLSEEGIKAILLKTEGQYLQDNQREMPKADAELFFVIDEKNNQIELTDKGIQLMSKNMEDERFFVLPDIGTEIAIIEKSSKSDTERVSALEELQRDYSVKSERIHTINQLLRAYALFERDKEYVVMDNKVKIVDEQTGRMMEGRRFSDGLHQAIEAKENVKVEAATQTYATITLQNYFRMYHKLAGMTGTAETEAGELWDIYKLDVMIIPTHRPISRKDQDDKIYKTKREKYNAVIEEIAELREAGRPVLVGTTTVEVSEVLSRMLRQRGIDHQVLNAKLHQKEAEIVSLAGKAGTVTIATNMAGRGTDIKLGEGVKDSGGLAIIGTERHDSRRVDRQLRGRSGRQGDPGSSSFYVSLEDDLMRLFGSDRIAKMMDRLGLKEGEVIQHSMITSSIERAQKKVEENNFGIRKRLLEFDDVMNAQREVIYKRRRHALFGERLKLDIDNMLFDLAQASVSYAHSAKNYDAYKIELLRYFGIEAPVSQDEFISENEMNVIHSTYEAVLLAYTSRIDSLAAEAFPVIENVYRTNTQGYQNIAIPFNNGLKGIQVAVNLEKAHSSGGKEMISALEKGITLAIIDQNWKEHLRAMDDLRSNVQFAAHEQKDPLLIYKKESFDLFRTMITKTNAEIANFLLTCQLPSGTQANQAPQREVVRTQTVKADSGNLNQQASQAQEAGEMVSQQRSAPVVADPKINRNEPCPCGSGKKYKSCHGK
ncbi:MAG: preprotein translocase subunit SecA [Flavobacteriales bacterium]|jgi:preprotein translocase subunit SecA|nr:preprotein translocase subunit SecA [Flavobacteriales bacterium]MDP4717787.1 preprotein translocase subunit SecA [Flavobacteriales bacterium]MDP4818456.1 preprotein translocase subunit SecA [Flavobacteriales bacterium]MDP4951953.1 preprotein translocase subunit SecA [Flavobacteriales bacterium]